MKYHRLSLYRVQQKKDQGVRFTSHQRVGVKRHNEADSQVQGKCGANYTI